MGLAGIAFASILWAIDPLYRAPIAQKMDALWIVFFEHALGFLLLLPWAIWKRKQIFGLRLLDWSLLLFIGAGGAAGATLLFSSSLTLLAPETAVVLQKIQPLATAGFAILLLGERTRFWFLIGSPLAIGASLVLSFPSLNFPLMGNDELHSLGLAYALGAIGIWALSTVLAKHLLRTQKPLTLLFWRLYFGMITLAGVAISSPPPLSVSVFTADTFRSLVFVGWVPGLLGMFFYYQGLRRSTAIAAAFMEMIFPVAAIGINAFALGHAIPSIRWVASVCLIGAIFIVVKSAWARSPHVSSFQPPRGRRRPASRHLDSKNTGYISQEAAQKRPAIEAGPAWHNLDFVNKEHTPPRGPF